jgi:hypothetical protein
MNFEGIIISCSDSGESEIEFVERNRNNMRGNMEKRESEMLVFSCMSGECQRIGL